MGNTSTSFVSGSHMRKTGVYKNNLPIVERGVSLQVAKQIARDLNESHTRIAKLKLGRDPTPGEAIVHGLVKEKADGISFAEYLEQDPLTAHLVGRCNVFLSHTWRSPFEETVAALEGYEAELPADSPPNYYFIDYFAINQFDPKKDLKKLGELAKDCDKLVLFSKPWHKPTSLGRAWCIFEIANAVLGDTEVILAMPPKEKLVFKREMGERLSDPSNMATFMEVFANVESSKMQASVKEDLDDIKKFMEKNLGGFRKVDIIVSSAMKKSLGKTTMNFCRSYSPNGSEEHGLFLLKSGHLFQSFGMYEYELNAAQMAREIFDDLKQENLVLIAMNYESIALIHLGRHAEELVLGKKLVTLYEIKFGKDHANTLIARYNLGFAYKRMERWTEAEEEFTRVLSENKKQQLPMSRDIRMTQNNLAEVLRDSGKDINRAMQLFKEVLNNETKHLGPDDVTVLLTLARYARCLALKGENAQALEFYKKALHPLVKTYGENDIDVRNLRLWIGESEHHLREKKE